MKVLLSLLKKYIDIDLSPEKIAENLTLAGIEVEHIEYIEPTFRGVVVAKVIKREKHPNADRLSIAEVFDGKNTLSLVCGAANCREGLITALAPLGATLYPEGKSANQLVISPVTIRGVASTGMLCSEKELGLADASSGIVELSQDFELGQSLDAYCRDVVFEISLTPNLGHCYSVLGVARDLAAILGLPLKTQPWQTSQVHLEKYRSSDMHVDITMNHACERYSMLMMDSIDVGPSPLWMRKTLEYSGIRSVNNIVDITNLVMLELGQPMHGFDKGKIEGHTLLVRPGTAQESLTLLDGTTKELSHDVVVIADTHKALACGGVIGGEEASIHDTTKTVLFESAYFTGQAIRKSRKALGVQTDSSKRFERGTDPHMTVAALVYAQQLLSKIMPQAKVVLFNDVKMREFADSIVPLRRLRTSQILGREVSINDLDMVFKRYGFAALWDGQDSFSVQVPARRHDIKEEIDLIEEVAKILGYVSGTSEQIPYITSTLPHSPIFMLQRNMRSRFIAEGLQEILCCDLISPSMANIVSEGHPIPQDSLVSVMNPMSQEQSVLRPSLLPGVLEVIQRNARQRLFDISMFELGNIHLKKNGVFSEEPMFALALSGKRAPGHFDSQEQIVDFFDLKGILENVFSSLGFSEFRLERSNVSIFHPGRQAKIFVGGVHVGMMGEIHPALLRRLDIQHRVVFAEGNLKDLNALTPVEKKMQALSEFPGSDRDWTVTINESVSLEEIELAIKGAGCMILEDVQLIGIWRSDKLGQDKKNITLRFVYRDKYKTVSQEEVDREHMKVLHHVALKLHLSI